MKYYVGIDLGGTFIKAGVVDEEYHILAKSSVPSQVDGDDEGLADRIAQAATMAMEQLGLTIKDITSVGVGTPGAVDTVNGVVVYANNLGFRNTPLGKYLEDRLHTSVYLENDANVAAYGEVLAGAAAGYKDVVVVTLGTGVGGGIIIDGKIYRGFNQFGGELGHMVVQYGGRQCTCGRKGCIEAYASATGLINMTKEAMEAHPESALWKVAPTLEEVNGKTAYDGMRMGDPVALRSRRHLPELPGGGADQLCQHLPAGSAPHRRRHLQGRRDAAGPAAGVHRKRGLFDRGPAHLPAAGLQARQRRRDDRRRDAVEITRISFS